MDEMVANNQAMLAELAETIEWSVGEFHLLIVRCNYARLRSRLLTELRSQLRHQHAIDLHIIHLTHGSPNLLATIHADIEQATRDHTIAEPTNSKLTNLEQSNTESTDTKLTSKPSAQAVAVTGFEAFSQKGISQSPPDAQLIEVLATLDQVRDEFRKTLSFPLILWLNDQDFSDVFQYAPNFASWASIDMPVFALPPATLITSLRQGIATLYETALDPTQVNLTTSLKAIDPLGEIYRNELPYALTSLGCDDLNHDPELSADLHFLQGLNASTAQEAIAHFHHSITHWRSVIATAPSPSPSRPLAPSPSLKLAIALFFLGRQWFWNTDDIRRHDSANYIRDDWQKAQRALEESLQLFDAAHRPDMVAKVIRRLQGALRRLEDWDALEPLARRAITLHQTYGPPYRLAMAYGFLADATLHQGDYEVARQSAQQALETLAQVPSPQRWAEGLYLSLLGQAEQHLGEMDGAIAHLERARELGDRGHPTVYSTILETLRQLYWQQKRYLEAYKLKQRRLEVEKIAGIRAFVGAGRLGAVAEQIKEKEGEAIAPEIYASGRQRDLERLRERIGRSDYKLIVIHGPSGVGKSSLVNAGLIPALEQRPIGTRSNGVVLMRKYGDWVKTLGDRISSSLSIRSLGSYEDSNGQNQDVPPETRDFSVLDSILQTLRGCDAQNLRPVLIFDQFEEFFFANPNPLERRRFFEFVGDCLQLPFVNVVLSLREDYIHFLLEANRLDSMGMINHDILSKNVLFPLGNFSPQEAIAIVQDLTQRSRSHLEPDLIESLVQELAGDLQEVRPIELQIVGAQLETENIHSLEQYRALGPEPKEELVSRYLQEVENDCGQEYIQLAELVLYLLTDERGTRPLKTQAELARELEDFPLLNAQQQLGLRQHLGTPPESLPQRNELDYVLRILCSSGMVTYLPEDPDDRYQLVHDYIAEMIRARKAPQLDQLMAELEEERDRRLKAEQLKASLEQELQQSAQQLEATKAKQAELDDEILLAQLELDDARADMERAIAATKIEVDGLGALRQLEFSQLDALLTAIRAAHRLKSLPPPSDTTSIYPSFSPLFALQQILETIREKNRISGFREWVGGICFHPHNPILISGNAQGTVMVRDYHGNLIQTIETEGEAIRDLAISANGGYIAVATENTVSIWTLRGERLTTFTAHQDTINSIDFHPESELIATAARNGTAAVWDLQGRQVVALEGHQKQVNQICFSPNGRAIATASGDCTARIWNMKGECKVQLDGFTAWVSSLSFHPHRRKLATASSDGMVRIWQGNTLIQEFQTYQGEIRDILFHPTGKMLATAGDNSTICLWTLEGEKCETLRGHLSQVRRLSFSPDGTLLATAAIDRTIRYWNLEPKKVIRFEGHQRQANSVQFSPDGKFILTASADRTARLWDVQGKELRVLRGHQKRVWSACFSPDGQWAATSSTDHTARLWLIGSPDQIHLHGHESWIRRICFSPDGQTMATASADTTSRLWDRNGHLLHVLPHGHEVWDADFSPDGQYLATADADGIVRLWTQAGTLRAHLHAHPFRISRVCFSPDGQHLATASADYRACIWSVKDILQDISPEVSDKGDIQHEDQRQIKPLTELTGHQGEIWDITFSPDGAHVATASLDRTVRLWGIDGTPINEFRGHRDGVYSVCFSPDGQTLASASADSTARLWRIKTLDQLLDQACEWVADYLMTNPLVSEGDRAICGITKQPDESQDHI